MSHHKDFKDKKKLSAVCGLFCPSCTVFIGTTEEPERLKGIAERFGQPVEAWKCEGCRSEKTKLLLRKPLSHGGLRGRKRP